MSIGKHIKEHLQLGLLALGGNTAYVAVVGDGSTIDSPAINAAVTRAGTGGTVIFPPGKTALIDMEHGPNYAGDGITGQTWIMTGAILKRCNQITATTTATLTNGTNVVRVSTAEAATFRVGSFINVKSGTNYAAQNRQISSINLGTGDITVSDNFALIDTAGNTVASFASGATVFTSIRMIASAVDDFQIVDGEFDGNRANNTTYPRWDLHNAIFASGNRNKIIQPYVHDEVGEGVVLGGIDSYCRDPYVRRTGGNGIHFTGPKTNYAWTSNPNVKFTNLGGSGLGHVDGAIILSNDCTDVLVENPLVEGSAYYAFGSIDENRNRGFKVLGGVARNCANLVDVNIGVTTLTSVTLSAGELTSAATNGLTLATIAHTGIKASFLEAGQSTVIGQSIEIRGAVQAEYNGIFTVVAETADSLSFYMRTASVSPATGTIVVTADNDNPKNITIDGLSASDCGILYVQSSATYGASVGPDRVSIANCNFHNTRAYVSRAHKVGFSGNQWYWELDNTTSAADIITVANSTDVTIADLVNVGGYDGVFVTGANCANVNVKGGLYRNQYLYGIHYNDDVLGKTCSVLGASVIAESGTTNASYFGVYTCNGLTVSGCHLNIQSGAHAIRGAAGGVSTQGAVCTGNTVYSPSGKASFRVPTGGYNNTFSGNFIQQGVNVDAGDAANNPQATTALNTTVL